MSTIVKKSYVIAAGTLLFLAGVIAWLWREKPPEHLDGVYVWASYVNESVLDLKAAGQTQVEVAWPASGQWRFEPVHGGYLMLRRAKDYELMVPEILDPDPRTGRKIWFPLFVIAPSRTVPGDWDVVEIREEAPSAAGLTFVMKPYPLKRPLPSVLHRVDDRRVLELAEKTSTTRQIEWDVRRKAPDSFYTQHPPRADHSDLLALASALVAAHPEDRYIRMLSFDARIAARDFKALEGELEQMQAEFERPSFLRVPFRRAEAALRAWKLSMARKNAFDLFSKLYSPGTGLAERVLLAREIWKYEACAMPLCTVWEEPIPNYLNAQVTAKVFSVLGGFMLLRGERAEALELMTANLRLGQLMGTEPALIMGLIGMSVRTIAISGLRLYALDGADTLPENEALGGRLERMNPYEPGGASAEAILKNYDMFHSEPISNFLPDADWRDAGLPEPYRGEADTRLKMASSYFQLLRLATAARHRQLSQGTLPHGPGEFAPLLGLPNFPRDPFNGEPMKVVPGREGIMVYSVGPDKADDTGAITYDPSNGTFSRGDVVTEVPIQRKYPFPRDGVRARTREELLRQFPNGLPADTFADTRGKPLGVSDTAPVYVYSYGPDGDEHDPNVMHPQVAYDPTNGTSSAGDLAVAIPVK